MLTEAVFQSICQHEGRFSNAKTDPGNADLPDGTPGMTYVGVARIHHPDWAGWITIDAAIEGGRDLNSDGLFDELRDELFAFYEQYVQDNLGTYIQGSAQSVKALIDHSITSGIGGATNVMQGVCVDIGFPCDVDGLPGPGTRAAIAKVNEVLVEGKGELVEYPIDLLPYMIFASRIRHYLAVVDANPKQLPNLRSWLRRSLQCLNG